MMLRDYSHTENWRLLDTALEQFIDLPPRLSLVGFTELSPDSFLWKIFDGETVYCLYAEDYVPSLEHVREEVRAFWPTEIQQRARDSQLQQDVKAIAKALEMYYLDNGRYPAGLCSSGCVANGFWSTTNDGSWANLANALVPKYISSLPSNPKAKAGSDPRNLGVYGYGYFTNIPGYNYCGAGTGQMYLLVYTLESGVQQDTLSGTCNTMALAYPGKSNYQVSVGGS